MNLLENSSILITGGTGSFGQAMCKQLLKEKVRRVAIFSRDELKQLEMKKFIKDERLRFFIGDIRDSQRLDLALHGVDYVVHAAALKHLVIVERFSREAYITNVLGTLNVLEAAKNNTVSQVINISTDKAANPTSNLGKTKRITELLVNEYSKSKGLNCCSVRFGNVFASRGSVIETFIHQIVNNLPVTLTDQNVTRYFMSHDEAANLILASARFEENGIFVQNMGKEILMSGVVEALANNLGVKYTIRLIGLQSGEKLHEELYAGEFEKTNIKEIVKVEVNFKSGLVDLVRSKGKPKDNKDTLKIIEEILK